MSRRNGGAASTSLKRFRERLEMAHQDAKRLDIALGLPMQAWFAQRSGIDKAAVSRMVNGKIKLTGYARGALSLLEEVNELTARARKAGRVRSIELLEEAAEEAAREAGHLEKTISRLREMCDRAPVDREKVLERAVR